VAEFGDLGTVVGEFTRQAPGQRAARTLLTTWPAVGACWAAALILSRAWTWPVPAATRLSFGAVLLLAVMAPAAAAASQHSYQRTRLTAAVGSVILVLDGTPPAEAGQGELRAGPRPAAGLSVSCARSLACPLWTCDVALNLSK
jgi:hypothetical protein